MGKGAQDACGNLGPTGDERQARQADHRVAAPIAEPGVARDDRTPVGIVGQGAAHDELIGSQAQVLHPGRRIGETALGRQPTFVCLPLGVSRRPIQIRRRLGAGHQGERLAGVQGCAEAPSVQVILVRFQSPVVLHAQKKVPVPVVLRCSLGLVAQKIKRRGALEGGSS